MRRVASGVLLLCIILGPYAGAAEPDPAKAAALARVSDLKFAHLTTTDGLAMNNVVSILQDHRGFMWFGTGDGLNRYDGNSFVAYKNNPNDPGSLSANFIRDLVEDDRGASVARCISRRKQIRPHNRTYYPVPSRCPEPQQS